MAAKANALALIAAAFNRGDLAMAAIATVQMQFPDPPLLTKAAETVHEVARRALELHRSRLLKFWDPAKHPRTGTPPNQGWFAPTDGGGNDSSPIRTVVNDDAAQRLEAPPTGSDNWVGLPPGDYIGELRDLLVWLANAKPEDEAAIRAEIKRRYYDVGDISGGNALNRALSDILDPDFDPNLHPDLDKERRQTILNSIAVYAETDPAEMGQIQNLLPLTILAAPDTHSPEPEISPAPADRPPEPEVPPSPEIPPNPHSGGRLGGAATRAQNAAIAAQLENDGFTIINGGATLPEEYIRGAGPGAKGGTYVDITAINNQTGAVVRVQTVDTLPDGTPTPRESAAAARIRWQRPDDTLILIPKRRAQ